MSAAPSPWDHIIGGATPRSLVVDGRSWIVSYTADACALLAYLRPNTRPAVEHPGVEAHARALIGAVATVEMPVAAVRAMAWDACVSCGDEIVSLTLGALGVAVDARKLLVLARAVAQGDPGVRLGLAVRVDRGMSILQILGPLARASLAGLASDPLDDEIDHALRVVERACPHGKCLAACECDEVNRGS